MCEWLFVSRVCGREISGVREQRRAANRRARVRVAWQKSEGEERVVEFEPVKLAVPTTTSGRVPRA